MGKDSSAAAGIDPGAVADGVYRNKALGLACTIPPGWVLRTDEMNERGDGSEDATAEKHQVLAQSTESRSASPSRDSRGGCRSACLADGCSGACSEVLLAAFSRPPEAKGEDVNGSILIAAESVGAYPGLKEAAQYFGPLTEVAKAQGFAVDEEPYESAVGGRNLVRGDFHKDVGTRVMRQSTLVFLARGYAVSITVIGGTEDEVEELIDGVSFAAGK